MIANEEELSEEDQQLKNELEVMVERLTVSIRYLVARSRTSNTDHLRVCVGIRFECVQNSARSDEDFDQDFDIVNDGSTQTTQVSTPTL